MIDPLYSLIMLSTPSPRRDTTKSDVSVHYAWRPMEHSANNPVFLHRWNRLRPRDDQRVLRKADLPFLSHRLGSLIVTCHLAHGTTHLSHHPLSGYLRYYPPAAVAPGLRTPKAQPPDRPYGMSPVVPGASRLSGSFLQKVAHDGHPEFQHGESVDFRHCIEMVVSALMASAVYASVCLRTLRTTRD